MQVFWVILVTSLPGVISLKCRTSEGGECTADVCLFASQLTGRSSITTMRSCVPTDMLRMGFPRPPPICTKQSRCNDRDFCNSFDQHKDSLGPPKSNLICTCTRSFSGSECNQGMCVANQTNEGQIGVCDKITYTTNGEVVGVDYTCNVLPTHLITIRENTACACDNRDYCNDQFGISV